MGLLQSCTKPSIYASFEPTKTDDTNTWKQNKRMNLFFKTYCLNLDGIRNASSKELSELLPLENIIHIPEWIKSCKPYDANWTQTLFNAKYTYTSVNISPWNPSD